MIIYELKLYLCRSFLALSVFSCNITARVLDTSEAISAQSNEVSSIIKDAVSNPLKPIETSSPRATMQSFMENIYKAYLVLMLTHKENLQATGILTPDSIKLKAKVAEILFQRCVRCLNLSKIPEIYKENIGYIRTIKLKEILDRIEIPPFDKIPGEGIEIDKEGADHDKPITWKIPETEVAITRVEDGPRKYEFLFSIETVDRLDEFYKKISYKPYIAKSFATPGFLNYYANTPGKFLPNKWSLWLPEWSYSIFFEQTLWQWIILLIYLIIAVILVIVFYRWINPTNLSLSPVKQNLKKILFLLLIIVMFLGLSYLDKQYIDLTGYVKIILTTLLSTLFWLFAAILILLILKLIAEIIIASPKINPADIQASYLRAVFNVSGFLLAIIIFIYGLSLIGVSLAPLLAGVGIGGLAIAIAARPTLENIIGSFIIFADKPFKVGQRILVSGYEGKVEEIGLRSTKIRLLSGNLTSIPNEKMVNLEIENIGHRPYIRRNFNLCITYNTPPEKITRAVEILNDILAVPQKTEPAKSGAGDINSGIRAEKEFVEMTHPNEAINRPGFLPRIYFNDFNSDSLNIYISYWYHPPKWWDYLEHSHWINLRIIEHFNAEGIKFAFPTQTIHLADEINNPKIE